MIPHRCPVCNGKGIVPSGFYETNDYSTASSMVPETCRSCHGTGVIWGNDVVHVPNEGLCPSMPIDWGPNNPIDNGTVWRWANE